jgi:hypothetical protein
MTIDNVLPKLADHENLPLQCNPIIQELLYVLKSLHDSTLKEWNAGSELAVRGRFAHASKLMFDLKDCHGCEDCEEDEDYYYSEAAAAFSSLEAPARCF